MLKGIDYNWIQDAFYGVLTALTIILFTSLFEIGSIGIPEVSAISVGAIGEFIIIVLLAGIFEEPLFRGFILDFFESKLKFGFLVGAILSSIAFSLFHSYAYGGSLSASKMSFISAFLVGMVFCYLVKYTNSLMPSIVGHSMLNFYIKYVLIERWIIFG